MEKPLPFIDATDVTSQVVLSDLARLRDSAAQAEGFTVDVTAETAALLTPDGLPTGLAVHAHRDSRPSAGAYPYLYFKDTSGDRSNQVMRIDPATGEVHIDDEVGAFLMFDGVQVHPALSGLTSYLQARRPAIEGQIAARKTEAARIAEEKRLAEIAAVERVREYPELSRVMEVSGLSATFLLERLDEHGVWDIGRLLNDPSTREAVEALFDTEAIELTPGTGFGIVYDKPLRRLKGSAIVTTEGADEFLGGMLADDVLGRDSAAQRLEDAYIAFRAHAGLSITSVNDFLRQYMGDHGDRKIYLSSDHTQTQAQAVRQAAQDSTSEWRVQGRAMVEVLPEPGRILPVTIRGYRVGGIFLADRRSATSDNS